MKNLTDRFIVINTPETPETFLSTYFTLIDVTEIGLVMNGGDEFKLLLHAGLTSRNIAANIFNHNGDVEIKVNVNISLHDYSGKHKGGVLVVGNRYSAKISVINGNVSVLDLYESPNKD